MEDKKAPLEFNLDLAPVEVEKKGSSILDPKFDWPLIRSEYINDRSTTLAGLSKKYGCSEISMRIHSSKEKWAVDRNKIHQEFVRVATTENLKRQARAALNFNSASLDAASKIIGLVNRRIDEAEAAGTEIESKELRELASSAKTAQEAGRLALGLSTDNKEITAKAAGEDSRTMDDINAELIALLGEEKFNAILGEKK